jgi:hypothetical protein
VSGKINLTCNAWQASNTDAYFAVTGHWINEVQPGYWKLQNALFGFTCLTSAHNGKRLGCSLFVLALCLAIVHKVSIL